MKAKTAEQLRSNRLLSGKNVVFISVIENITNAAQLNELRRVHVYLIAVAYCNYFTSSKSASCTVSPELPEELCCCCPALCSVLAFCCAPAA